MELQYYSVINQCRSCGGKDFQKIYQIKPIPVAGIYYNSNEKPVNLSAPMTLICCESCGLIQLRETINQGIYMDYSFAGNTADLYQSHLRTVATELVNTWGISNKTVFEVGASNGVFLKYLSQIGGNKVLGIEPSQKLCIDAQKNGVNVQQGYFNNDFVTKKLNDKFDAVIIRHVLEHIDQIDEMVTSLKRIVAKNGLLVVEVPDAEKILNDNLFSNIFHEHLNYFTTDSLNYLFAKHGFKMVYKREVNIHGGSLLIIYKIGQSSNVDRTPVFSKMAGAFAENALKYYTQIHDYITRLSGAGKTVHGYGASHRTFVLLGNSNLNENDIPVIYDNNPFLHNKRLNGFNSLIVPPALAGDYHPNAIVVFATSYEDEIICYLKDVCNFKGDIISLKYEVICGEH